MTEATGDGGRVLCLGIEGAFVRRLERCVTTAGVTLLIAFAGAEAIIGTIPYDSPRREAAQAALAATWMLQILWVLLAGTLGTLRWRRTNILFWVVLFPNAIVAFVALLFLSGYTARS